MPVEWMASSRSRAKSAKIAPHDPPSLIGANLGVVRALRSAVLAPYIKPYEISTPSGSNLVCCMYPHVKILSKVEVLGPRNGRGPGPRQNPSNVNCFVSEAPALLGLQM